MSNRYLDVKSFKRAVISDLDDAGQIQQAVEDMRTMVLCILDEILNRCERDASFPFINTKLSVVTGRDFPDSDPIRGRDTIYSWIQGRGLEALVGHNAWIARQGFLDDSTRHSFDSRIRAVVARVAAQMERIRQANDGRLHFMMTRDGRPMQVVDGKVVPARITGRPATSMNEMFYCKGLVAAGWMLGDDKLVREAVAIFDDVIADVLAGTMRNDQQQLDPRNPVGKAVANRRGNGGRMIGIGAAARFLECTGDARYARLGLDFIEHMLATQVNTSGQASGPIQPNDMWEFNDLSGRPFVDGQGRILNDPGHSTEFTGLAFKHIMLARRLGLVGRDDEARAGRIISLLPAVMVHNFRNGFSPMGLGIVKAFDLVSRTPINDQMPWWNLPETIRAGALAYAAGPDSMKRQVAQVAVEANNCFVTHYVRPELHLMAPQTLGADGRPVDVIPANPDADPGYHTGLSLLDALDMVK